MFFLPSRIRKTCISLQTIVVFDVFTLFTCNDLFDSISEVCGSFFGSLVAPMELRGALFLAKTRKKI